MVRIDSSRAIAIEEAKRGGFAEKGATIPVGRYPNGFRAALSSVRVAIASVRRILCRAGHHLVTFAFDRFIRRVAAGRIVRV